MNSDESKRHHTAHTISTIQKMKSSEMVNTELPSNYQIIICIFLI